MILIKGAQIYTPEDIGRQDILICGKTIAHIANNIDPIFSEMKVIDGTGMILVPGFIDQHVHVTGGGGEGGFATRVPEIMLSTLTKNGITTVVGLLGTDASTRNVESLIAKVKGLKKEGLSAYAITGSYELPTVTLTGSVKKDIIFIDEIIGAKVALSDHRGSEPTCDEIAKLALDARVAGMISGKAGFLTIHVGNGKNGLQKLFEIVRDKEIPIKTLRPTHVNRRQELLKEAFEFARMGGLIDLTAGISRTASVAEIIVEAYKEGIPLENITISSDGGGSWSNYDNCGKLVEIGVSGVDGIFKEIICLVKEKGFKLEDALNFGTSNPAKALGIFPQKGAIAEGSDADIILMNNDLEIETVIANGKIHIQNREILIKGTYEHLMGN